MSASQTKAPFTHPQVFEDRGCVLQVCVSSGHSTRLDTLNSPVHSQWTENEAGGHFHCEQSTAGSQGALGLLKMGGRGKLPGWSCSFTH